MKVIDLTQVIHEDMPVFPGTEKPVLNEANTVEKDGFAEKKITMYSHTGTHMDAPYHMESNGLTLDRYDIEKFVGKAAVLDFSDCDSGLITLKDIEKYENLIVKVDFIIFKTGWSRFWGKEEYFNPFPVLDVEAAKWLSEFNLKGLGVDAISFDHIKSRDFPVHHILFKKNFVLVENLTNLDTLDEKNFIFSCTPLKIKDADGSPVRAVAIIE